MDWIISKVDIKFMDNWVENRRLQSYERLKIEPWIAYIYDLSGKKSVIQVRDEEADLVS